MKKSRRGNPFVIPAQAVIQLFQWVMNYRLRGSDGFRLFYDTTFSSTRKKMNNQFKGISRPSPDIS
jgi:hypothetical protein